MKNAAVQVSCRFKHASIERCSAIHTRAWMQCLSREHSKALVVKLQVQVQIRLNSTQLKPSDGPKQIHCPHAEWKFCRPKVTPPEIRLSGIRQTGFRHHSRQGFLHLSPCPLVSYLKASRLTRFWPQFFFFSFAMPRARLKALRLSCTLCGKTIRCANSLEPHYRREHQNAFNSETGELMARLGPDAYQNSSQDSLLASFPPLTS